LGNSYRDATGHDASVHVLALASLNGRKPELLVDPNVDLFAEPRGFYARSWIPPSTEPLRRPAWQVPVSEWREHVDIPELRFLTKSTSVKGAKPQTSAAVPATSANEQPAPMLKPS
jgi:hypothetical protein